MSRFAPGQADLFARAEPDPLAEPAPVGAPERPALEQLAEALAALRAAEQLPWPDVTAAMAEEQRILGLARQAGAEGARLATLFMDESERLFAAAEREAMRAALEAVERGAR